MSAKEILLPEKALLPSGFHDLLPPDAASCDHIVTTLMEQFALIGYERIAPPLVEFERSLVSGTGKSLDKQTFRLMDPHSQSMMGIRSDITTQIARIAAVRLQNAPKPLRLSYAGTVLRVNATDLHGKRERTQAGIELIGSQSLQAECEVIMIVVFTLQLLGAKGLSIDFTLPRLKQMIIKSLGIAEGEEEELIQAVRKKETSAVTHEALLPLVMPSGDTDAVLGHIETMDIPKEGKQLCKDLRSVIADVQAMLPDITITIDPLDNHGFHYHTGIGFTLYSQDDACELGRGGRYKIHDDMEAVGFTLYVDTLFHMLPAPEHKKKVFIPQSTPCDAIKKLQEDGYITIFALEASSDESKEAKRMQCDFVWQEEQLQPV